MISYLTPDAANALVLGRGEVAFLDLREAGPFADGHPLFAIPCPWSTFEDRVRHLVPRRGVRVILVDAGDGIAERAADALDAMEYEDISVLTGGTPAWEGAGLRLFKGVNVPSKTLGELAEHIWHPAMIDADILAAWQAEGKRMHFFDCRPPGEFSKMTIKGTVCLPNGELAHRLDAAVDDDAPVLLTCAGRTRGIIGAVGLARLYPGREIYALENGTQGWVLSGRALERGCTPSPMPALDAAAARDASGRADAFMAEEGIAQADAQMVQGFLDDSDRTTFLIDVRSAEEAAADPLPGFTHALSGQLVQATDQWIGVRGARVILADDPGLRGAFAAFWLRALGYEPYVCRIDAALRQLTPRDLPAMPVEDMPEIAAEDALAQLRNGGASLLDVRHSDAYRARHPAGAVWGIRSCLGGVSSGPGVIFLIGDGTARTTLAARELRRLGHGDVRLVRGGAAALEAAGAPFESTPDLPAVTDSPDVTWFAHGRHDDDLEASRTYLKWETSLIGMLDPAERAAFRI